MRSHLIAVGKRMPAWVTEGFNEYNKRLPRNLKLDLVEITPAVRGKTATSDKIMKDEASRIRAAMPEDSFAVLLDERGRQLNSQILAKKLGVWFLQGRDVTFVIGGADGLADDLKKSADMLWSLSSLTLPHALARVMLVEQIYRAWTILQKHPYHRE
jgi:23S rRNA (pseudouridine1915-N3)-methyltransferase